MITAITPTGNREEAFTLCRKWMSSQTIPIDQWIVVDDGSIPLPEDLRKGVDYIRREPKQGEGHTLILNLKEALPFIKGDKILIIEDDDWYGPDYVRTMSQYLSKYSLVGEGHARYYLVPTLQYRRIPNTKHASLCQTGFRKELLPIFEQCFPGNPYLDARFWETVNTNKFIFTDLEDKLKLHCSTKGLRGRKGIGTGHDANSKYYRADDKLSMLIRWVGLDNAKIYMHHVGQSFKSSLLVDSPKSKMNKAFAQPVIKKAEEVAVVTCTGDRPESFELLRMWMNKQTVKPKQWIVVDDGKVPIKTIFGFEYYRREPKEGDYLHTLCLNLPLALEKVKCEKVIIMEDDDWYHPTYIDYMSNLLDKADLVGFANLIFYYPSLQKYMVKGTAKQPALAQTAFRKEIIPIIHKICNTAPSNFELCGKGLVDAELWKHSLGMFREERSVILTTSLKITSGQVLEKGTVFHPPLPLGIIKRADRKSGAEYVVTKNVVQGQKLIVRCEEYLTVGMKGMSGRAGLTTHHDENNGKYKGDIGGNLLKSILKEDANFYLK